MVYALLDNVRSLFNVGAIFRTADGAGVSKLFLTGITGRPPHREIRKVALGAEEVVPWEYHADAQHLVRDLKQQGVRIVALETTPDSVPYDRCEYRFPLCLLVGHEYDGIGAALLRQADACIHIPMRGRKTSLNVSVAFGIAAYEITKYCRKGQEE